MPDLTFDELLGCDSLPPSGGEASREKIKALYLSFLPFTQAVGSLEIFQHSNRKPQLITAVCKLVIGIIQLSGSWDSGLLKLFQQFTLRQKRIEYSQLL